MRRLLVVLVLGITAVAVGTAFLLHDAEAPVPRGTLEPASQQEPRDPTNPIPTPQKADPKEIEAVTEQSCRIKMRRLGVISAGPCIDISSIVDGLAEGTYVFNKPERAFVGEPFKIVLALKTSVDQDVKESFSGLAGGVIERQGKFAQSIEANLRGDDLSIQPEGPQARTATTTEAIEWEWSVTPKVGGQKTIIIEVTANIEAGNEKHKVKVKTLREAIVIQVSALQRMKTYVAEANAYVVAASATITAVAGLVGFVPAVRRFVLDYLRRRRRPERYGR